MKRKEYVESMSREDEEKGREEKRRFKTQRRLAPFTNREKQEYVSK
jgi:hypothetical protein